MEQVYSNNFGIRLVSQNPDDAQQNFIIDQQENIMVQDDTQSQQQHIVYSPVKANELSQQQTQFITQEDSMQNQYLIQQPHTPQQVFYANVSPSNQNSNRIVQQAVALNHNLIHQQNQQKQLVIQTPQKVVIQRNSDLMQANQNMTQVIDQNQQTIQYNFQPQTIDQNQQIIIQQQHSQSPHQMKQAIYQQASQQQPQQQQPQQQPQNQIFSPQPQYIQLHNIPAQANTILQQSGNKIIIPNSNSPIRYSIVAPKQTIQSPQNQQGQVMQIQQGAEQGQQIIRTVRPRFTPMKITRAVTPQLPTQQIQQRPRVPRYQTPQQQVAAQRNQVVRPQLQTVQTNAAQPRYVQANNARLAQVVNAGQNHQQQFIIVQQQGQQFLIAQPVNQSQIVNNQLVRTIAKRVESPRQTNQNFQQQPAQQPQAEEIQGPEQSSSSEDLALTTSTLPKKEGDCDDLEESITATAISKGNRPEPQPQQRNIVSQNQQPNQLQPRVGVVRPMMTNQINRATLQRTPALQIIRQRAPPRPQYQPGLQHELGVERESAKMLVILDNGEQRLITFTLPKETCTVQELLDQVGIEIGADSNIECIENPGSEIDYIVKVGHFASRDTTAMTKAAENHIRQQQAQQRIQQRNLQSTQTEVEATKSPEPTKLPPPKYVDGFFAVCTTCGFSGVDHAKCERCHRIFTEDVKTVRMPQMGSKYSQISLVPVSKISMAKGSSQDRKDQIEAIQKKHQIAAAEAQRKSLNARRPLQVGNVGMIITPVRPKGSRNPRKPNIPEIVTLSSDESDSESGRSNGKSSNGSKKEPVVHVKKPYEPTIEDDTPPDDFVRHDVTHFEEGESNIEASIQCRTIRIGSYKFDCKEKVVFTAKGIRIVAPTIKNMKDMVVLNIQQSEVVKLVTHFSKQLSIIFLYTKPSCARYIVDQLQMTQVNEKSFFYSPLSDNEAHKKIVFLTDNLTDETKGAFKALYTKATLEEINNRDANELLVRSTGIAVSASQQNSQPQNPEANQSMIQNPETEVKKLLIYPKGRGGISITTYDYYCLAIDTYLNDVIIDFYLKYVHMEKLSEEQQEKTHIFSQFFYKRLTTMTKEKDPKLSAAQKRHQRVQSWTKNVNLFEKDFIIVPINEQSHWFLAIICFPNLTEPHTMDTNLPIKLNPSQRKGKLLAEKKMSVQIGNTTITPLTKKDDTIELNDDHSERDEAEGDDSELGSNEDEDEEEEEVIDKGQPVKVPCILIFDSLGGTSRARVVATLRDYLSCEYRAKYPNNPPRVYNKTNMFGSIVKAPQQQNFTDCGLFLLQYVEEFFANPIKDYRLPIKTLGNWFHQDVVTRKREDIAKLIKDLIVREGFDEVELPKIEFPTKDGKVLEQIETPHENSQDDNSDDRHYVEPTVEESKEVPPSEETVKRVYLPKKRSLDSKGDATGESAAKNPKMIKNKSA